MSGDTNHMVALTAQDGSEVEQGTLPADRSVAARLVVSDDQVAGLYDGKVDGAAAAGVVYTRAGDRVTLLATSVLPEFRGKGVAAAMLRKVLDDVRSHGGTVTVTCPFVARFVAAHPEYADVIDPDLPGVPRHHH